MIDHIGFPVSDYARAKAFYLKALAPLGYGLIMEVKQEDNAGEAAAGFGRDGKPDFWVASGRPAGEITHFHVAFVAKDRAMVRAFYAAAMATGGVDNGGPGLRPHYHPDYYGAYVRDLDGNKICAMHRIPA